MVRTDRRLDRGALEVRGARLVWGFRTYVVAIVNVTPDSFSGDGIEDAQAAALHAVEQWSLGADLLDFGGESTRPGHRRIDDEVEIARVVPAIRATRALLPAAPISIDTYKPVVARAAHAAGADVVNSVWGCSDDLLATAAELGMPMVAMHNQEGTHYDGGVVDSVLAYLEACAERAMRHGIAPERIVLDPGIGFGKDAGQNLAVLASLDRFAELGFPTMLGASRKSTLGKLTGREPQERVFATAATTALAVTAGMDMVRVHDVAAARDAVAVSDAIVRGWRPDGWTE
jgi:dihydropteroate synthase